MRRDSRAYIGYVRGHHPFAKQWANDYAEFIGDRALDVLSKHTIGSDVKWDKGHPNEWGPKHAEYNSHSGRQAVEKFIVDKNITPLNPMTAPQAHELLNKLQRLEFNQNMQDYANKQRANGRVNVNRVFRNSGDPN